MPSRCCGLRQGGLCRRAHVTAGTQNVLSPAGGLDERQMQREVAGGPDIITGTPSEAQALRLPLLCAVCCIQQAQAGRTLQAAEHKHSSGRQPTAAAVAPVPHSAGCIQQAHTCRVAAGCEA